MNVFSDWMALYSPKFCRKNQISSQNNECFEWQITDDWTINFGLWPTVVPLFWLTTEQRFSKTGTV